MKTYTIVETFVGCGGAHLGFQQNGFRSLLVNDIDSTMIDTLIQNKVVDANICLTCPIENITEEILKERIHEPVDVLFGGIVCKGFSLAGVRNPFDARNYLYRKQLQLVKMLNPKVSIIENVVGFKNMTLYRENAETASKFHLYNEKSELNKKLNGQKSSQRKQGLDYKELDEQIRKNKAEMQEILSQLEMYKYNIYDEMVQLYADLGYTVYDKVLTAGNYNGYTSRKRIIIVAVRNDIRQPYEFPKEEQSFTLEDALQQIDYEGINHPSRDKENIPMKHTAKTIERFKYIPEGKNIADVMDTIPSELKISAFYSRGNTQRLHRKYPCPTLVPGHSNFPLHPIYDRSITIREAATITGFPLTYTFCGSHTMRCMQIGNAVPVYLADAIAKSILPLLV